MILRRYGEVHEADLEEIESIARNARRVFQEGRVDLCHDHLEQLALKTDKTLFRLEQETLMPECDVD